MSGTRERIDAAIGSVLFNVSNFPEKAQSRLLGQDMAPLRERLTSAVLDALSTPPADDVHEASTDAPTHTWVHARQERPGEISLRCSCGLAWKHNPIPYGTGANLPGCPDATEVGPRGMVTDAATSSLRGEPVAVTLLRMFVREHDEGDGPERVLVEVADLRCVLRLLDAAEGRS